MLHFIQSPAIWVWTAMSRLTSKYVQYLFVTVVLITCLTLSSPQASFNSDWPFRIVGNIKELSYCDALGYLNATLNQCEYCTEGNTGLLQDFGKDCNGVCGGTAVIDCSGVCGGQAFIDECSGKCTDGRTVGGISANTLRDCSGFCSESRYVTNSCGVCHAIESSPFQDCTNKCYLPGKEHLMAELKCGRCFRGSSGIPESEVLDACGNCKSEDTECPCNGTGSPDLCGMCNGGGKTCFRVIEFFPQAIPNGTEVNVIIKGAFRGRNRNLKCLLNTILPNNELGEKVNVIGSSGNGTHVRCRVRLNPGLYRVGVSLEVSENPEIKYVEEAELLVYDDFDYADMAPSKAVYDRGSSSKLVLTFTGGNPPNRPLFCIVTGEGWPSKYRVVKSETNFQDTCSIPFPNASMKLNIAPSLNGIHSFKKTFFLIFYASPPEMKMFYIAEDGHAVIVVFDHPVNLCQLKTCSDILNFNTIGKLGQNATCRWATKQQLIISNLQPILGVPFAITFKRGVLKRDDQKYALPKNDSLTVDAFYPQVSSTAQISISGPSTISQCGIFTLVGHFSSPKGDAEFFWTANRHDREVLKPQLHKALTAAKSASLTLNASILEIGINYTFILTAEHLSTEKYEARHMVSRKPYIGPLVTAFSSAINDNFVPVNQEIILQAEVSLPECATDYENVRLMWTVDNPRVKFDFAKRFSYMYRIKAYSLPENSIIVFTANAFFGNFLNVTSSKIVIKVEPFKLKAVIKGGPKRTVGDKYCDLVLENENINDKIPLTYQWRCFDKNGSLCYDYAANASEALLINKTDQKGPTLKIPCYKLKAGQELNFELFVFNKNNHNDRSSTSTTVIVQAGNIPQVVIQSVTANGIKMVQKYPTSGAYPIPAELRVIIHATIKTVRSKLKSVQWEVKGFSNPFTYSTMKENTYLTLEEGFLVDHGIYSIGLSACNNENMCGIANLTIHAVPGVTVCELLTNPYIEYEVTIARVVGCSIPIGCQPLTYQLYLHRNGDNFPFTPPQTSTIFSFAGPPVLPNNTTRMSVEVCDKFNRCKLFGNKSVKVISTENRNEERYKLLDKAQIALKTNDPVMAMSCFLIAFCDTQIPVTDDQIEAMLESAKKVTENRYISSGQLALTYSAMLPLLRNSSTSYKLKALDVIKRATKLACAHQVKLPLSTLKLGYNNINEAIQCSTDTRVVRKVRLTLNAFLDSITPLMPLGNRLLLEGNGPGQPTTLLFRQLLDRSPISIKTMSKNGVVEGIVGFEDTVREKVRNWRCNKTKNCEGAVVSLTLYPGLSPYPSKDKFVSPAFDISLRKPDTGLVMPFNDETNVVRMSMTHSGNVTAAKEKGMASRCFYWDESEKEWKKEGVLTMGVEGKVMTCWSSHMSTFAVLEAYDGLSTASIVGIVVASLMGVFIFGMVAFFFVRKKQSNAAKISTEELLPKRVSKTQGIERSIAQVKRMTP